MKIDRGGKRSPGLLPGGALEQASVIEHDSAQVGVLPALSLNQSMADSLGSFGLNDSESMADTLDTRKFKDGAKVFMQGGFAVEKTLLTMFKTKTSAESRENMSLSSESLGAVSVGPGFYRASQFNSLSDSERLSVNIWNAFKKYSLEQGDKPCDAGSRGLPVDALLSSVLSISKSLSPVEVSEIIRSRQFPSNAMLSLPEFRSFIESLFSPKAAPLTLTGVPPSTRLRGAARADYEYSGLVPIPDPRSPDAFHRLQLKQRGAASVVFAALPPHVSSDIGVSESITVMPDGNKVPTQMINSAMLTVLKTHNHEQKKQLKRALNSKEPGVAEAAEARLKATITEPLLKHKVYGMTHANETYAAKWERMKAKRDERVAREVQRATRCEQIENINRIVLTGERRTVKKILESRSEAELRAARERVLQRISDEQELAERISLKEEQARLKRQESASVLRAALEEASLLTQSIHEDSVAEKKAAITPFVLNPSSSALVKVPNELVVRVAKARSLEGWMAAKKAERDFWESTLDSRINRYAFAKYEKMLRIADVGARISITEISSAPPSATSQEGLPRRFSDSMRDTTPFDGSWEAGEEGCDDYDLRVNRAPSAPRPPSPLWRDPTGAAEAAANASRNASRAGSGAGSGAASGAASRSASFAHASGVNSGAASRAGSRAGLVYSAPPVTTSGDDSGEEVYLQSIAMDEYLQSQRSIALGDGDDDMHARAPESPVNLPSETV